MKKKYLNKFIAAGLASSRLFRLPLSHQAPVSLQKTV